MEFKINIGDPKTGRAVKKIVSDKQAEAFLKKRIGEKISGDEIGFSGYEFEISGGSDYCGFPMRRDVRGTARKRILIVSGVGIRKNRKGRKVRKTVAGNTIYSKTAQINLKILKYGSKPLAEEKKEEKAAEKAPEAEKKAEAPKEEKKAEEKKEDKKPKSREGKEEEKKSEVKKEEPKKEEKPKEDKK